MKSELEKQIDKLKELGADIKITEFSKNDRLIVKMPKGCLDETLVLGLNGRVGDKGGSSLLDVAIEEIENLDETRCRICGCSDSKPCPGGCYWIEPDLCNKCEGKVL